VIDQTKPGEMGNAAAILLESMHAVQHALAKSLDIPAEQLATRIQEWQRLVVELSNEPAPGVELSVFYDTIKLLNSSLDLTETLNQVMDSLIELTGAERSCLMLFDREGKLEIQAARHFDQNDLDPSDLKLSHTVVQDAIAGREPVLTTNAQLDPRFSAQDSVIGYQLRSIVCVPLYVRERVIIGALYLDNRMKDGVFSQSDLPMLTAFASQAAVAIENARLYEEVYRHADELTATVVKLQELDRLKSEFIQNVSHELRTPLAVIQGYTTLLEAGEFGELQPEQQEPVTIISRRIGMLRETVEDITLILGAETNTPALEPVMLSQLVSDAVQDLKIAIEHAELTLRTEIPPNLPPVNGSPVYLRRIVDNLLNNAIKFTPAGGTIDLRVQHKNDQVVLEVTDTGIGISPEHRERIFDRFYQVDGSTSRRYGGMGLGLALVKEIVGAHGGTVDVKSKPGKGSTFTVTLNVFPARS
jgi:signal transduction histidine kinase